MTSLYGGHLPPIEANQLSFSSLVSDSFITVLCCCGRVLTCNGKLLEVKISLKSGSQDMCVCGFTSSPLQHR